MRRGPPRRSRPRRRRTVRTQLLRRRSGGRRPAPHGSRRRTRRCGPQRRRPAGVKLRWHDLQFADLSHAKLNGPAEGSRPLRHGAAERQGREPARAVRATALYSVTSERQPTIKPTDARYSLLLHAAGTWRGPHREMRRNLSRRRSVADLHLRGRSFAYADLARTHRFSGKAQALVNLTGADLTTPTWPGRRSPAPPRRSPTSREPTGRCRPHRLRVGRRRPCGIRPQRHRRPRRSTSPGPTCGSGPEAAPGLGASSLAEADLHGSTRRRRPQRCRPLRRRSRPHASPAGATLCDTVMPDGTIASPATDCEHR